MEHRGEVVVAILTAIADGQVQAERAEHPYGHRPGRGPLGGGATVGRGDADGTSGPIRWVVYPNRSANSAWIELNALMSTSNSKPAAMVTSPVLAAIGKPIALSRSPDASSWVKIVVA